MWELSGNELTHNLSGKIQPQSSQLTEPLWTDPGIKSGINVHELISTLKKINKKSGGEWIVEHSPQILANKEKSHTNCLQIFLPWEICHFHDQHSLWAWVAEPVPSFVFQIPDGAEAKAGLKHSTVPRFCEDVRYQSPQYAKYFKQVFVNNTFRLYKVM